MHNLFVKFYSLLPYSKCHNISLAFMSNFVSMPSYYNYTACVYCEGWDLNDLYSGTRTHVLSQDLGLCQKVELEKFCLNNYSMFVCNSI